MRALADEENQPAPKAQGKGKKGKRGDDSDDDTGAPAAPAVSAVETTGKKEKKSKKELAAVTPPQLTAWSNDVSVCTGGSRFGDGRR